MPAEGTFTVPEAIWDHHRLMATDSVTKSDLPNFEGLILFTGSTHPMVMNTWFERGERCWDLVCSGWYVPDRVLNEFLYKKAS